MKVDIGDVQLFFDVEGAKLVLDGPRMREKPTLLVLQGGPGFDYSHLKSAFSALTDVAQLVYVDHRGQGRSDRSSPEHWHLIQWADDIRAFCRALNIEQPVILGLSFGGFVAQAYVHDPAQGESQHQSEKADDILSIALSRTTGSGLASQTLQAILFVPDPVG